MGGPLGLGGGGYRGLVSGILLQAVYDWRGGGTYAVQQAECMGFEGLEAELTEFLQGRWCEVLLEWIECDRVGIGERLLREGYGAGAVVGGDGRRRGARGPRG